MVMLSIHGKLVIIAFVVIALLVAQCKTYSGCGEKGYKVISLTH